MPPPPPPVNPQRLSPAESRQRTLGFFQGLGVDVPLPASAERPDAYSSLVRAIVSSAAVTSSRVSCTITISPAVTNQYNTLHGGAVAAVAEAVGMACARAAAGDTEMFLGELSTAYLAAARLNLSFPILNSQRPDTQYRSIHFFPPMVSLNIYSTSCVGWIESIVTKL